MKKIKQFLTVLALCLSCAVAYAVDNGDLFYPNSVDGLYYRVLSEARGTVAVACGDVSSIEPYPEMIMEHEYMWWKGNVYTGGAAEVSLAPGLYIVSASGAESVKVLVK